MQLTPLLGEVHGCSEAMMLPEDQVSALSPVIWSRLVQHRCVFTRAVELTYCVGIQSVSSIIRL